MIQLSIEFSGFQRVASRPTASIMLWRLLEIYFFSFIPDLPNLHSAAESQEACFKKSYM